MAPQKEISREGLNRIIDIPEYKDGQDQPEDSVRVAAQPIQVTLCVVLSHEQHDRCAAVQRGHREQIERAQQKVEREHGANKVLGKRVEVQPALVQSHAQENQGDEHQSVV